MKRTGKYVGMLDKKVSVRMDADRLAFLEECARAEGFSVSVIVRHLVYRFVEDRRKHAVSRLS